MAHKHRSDSGALTLAGNERPDGQIGGQGVLAPIAAKVLMKVFYAARVCRPDLLRAITFLACTMTKWSADCDRRLHKLMCYVYSTQDYVQVAWIGDPLKDLRLHLYSGADFAGCQSTNRSTSGVFLALEGKRSSCPIGFNCKKQFHTCYATAESESVAGCFAL